ncbi:PTS sugar transporter subunit IIC [Lacticaseibacillus suilingensis]|uniref:Permease IIC component n=1 Tax=Lacticaseibacillus suilingensis TaxID=2799577 RepID=A0ABW4BDU2_9LACO|nr:PTS transporter subunit EIIC [Lacticaseibacillus suilingensis]
MDKPNAFVDKLTMFASKFANNLYMRTLRDAFVMIMPLYTLAGFGVLLNNVVFPLVVKGDALAKIQTWGTLITNGTLNAGGLIVAPVIAFMLGRNKNFTNPIMCSIVAMAAFIMTMPLTLDLLPVGGKKPVSISGVLAYSNIGANGMFTGLLIGLFGTLLFLKVSSIKRLHVNLGDNVPPAVGQSFDSLIPAMVTLSVIGIIGAVLIVFLNSSIMTFITTIIQEPLRRVNTSLPGMLFIYGIGSSFFFFGIHPFVNSTLLDPVLLINMNKNMLAFSQGKPAPYILTNTFRDIFGQIGGTGSTIALLIAVFIFSRVRAKRDIAKLAILPSIFQINEPTIFGYPIVFNLPLFIPFFIIPVLNILIAYGITAIGWMSRVVVMVPWTTPPIMNAYLATGGDWRAAVVHTLIIALDVLIYFPFMKIADHIFTQSAKEETV